MKPIITFFIFLASAVCVYSQDYKDTTFTISGYTCSCKYKLDTAAISKIFDKAAIPAHFPGGIMKWNKYVRKNRKDIFKGNQTVKVRFVVDRDGNTSDFILQSYAEQEKFQEAVRLIKSSGKWFPSVQNGFCEKSYVRTDIVL